MRKTFKPTKSLLSLFSAITLLHPASPLRAAEFFVAPGGQPAGDGSAARPWNLQTALYHPAALKPGDILWLRGGTYRAPRTSHIGRTYFCTLNGTEANPILIKQFPGEATVVDGGIFCRAGSGWYQFWGFRITNTDTDRFITADSNVRATGLFLEGRGAKVINMVIDNVATPIFWGDSGLPNGDNAEIYGCILYGGGVYDAKTPGYTPENPWVRGNALYTQNKNGKRSLRDNICFRNFTGGFMIYGEGGYANGLTMEGNIAFDPAGGAAFEATSTDHPTESIAMLNNYAFSEKPGNLFWVGYQSENNQNATFIGNYGAGLGSWTTGLMRVKNFDSATIRSNVLFCWGPNKSIASIERVGGASSFPFDWDYNSYYSSNNTAFITNNALPQKTFSEWKAVTGYDRHSSFANAAPTNLVYFTRRNKYDEARSHLVVFNWAQAPALNYDLSLAGFKPGARFEIRDVQNYFGAPAVSGIYKGSPVAIPLTLTSVSPIVGKLIHFENKHTPRAFNTFVIINSPATNPVPPGNGPPTVNAGADRTAMLPNSVALQGIVSDDGLPNPPALVNARWSKVSGPGNVTFGHPTTSQTTASFSAVGTNSLTTTATFTAPGTYLLRLSAHDGEFSTSDDLSVVVRGVVAPTTDKLTMKINGVGQVSPNPSGYNLILGRTYSIAALPGAGQIFAGWTGNINLKTPRLVFVMQSNLVLQANFVSNPFTPFKGPYNGLFYETHDVRHESSGFFSALVTEKGAFSCRLRLGNKTCPWTGQFDVGGRASKTLLLSRTNSLTIELRLGLANGNDQITGTVSDGAWMAELLADRVSYQAGPDTHPFIGKYTLAIPGGSGPNAGLVGDGFGSLNVDTMGRLRLAGELADGTKISQAVIVSREGLWPLYVPLYGGRGSIVSWISFPNGSGPSLTGLLSWIRPKQSQAKIHSAGFTNQSQIYGSRYRPPLGATNLVLSSSNAVLVFGETDASETVRNSVPLLSRNRVITTGSSRFEYKFLPAIGLFHGKLLDWQTRKAIQFRGAILQERDLGTGYYLSADQSGHVRLEPVP